MVKYTGPFIPLFLGLTLLIFILLVTLCSIVAMVIIGAKRLMFRKKSRRGNSKQQVIRLYSTHLGQKLQKRYGVRQKYAPAQIKATIKSSGLSSELDCYAIAMYANRDEFIAYHRSIGEYDGNYDTMRGEISQCLSLTDDTFSATEAIDAGWQFDRTESDRDRDNSIDYASSSSYDSSSSSDSSSSDSSSSSD